MKTASKNAIAQSLHRLVPDIKRDVFFGVMGIPQSRTSVMRYWAECYNILAWGCRSGEERSAAEDAAAGLLASALENGYSVRDFPGLDNVSVKYPKITKHLL